MHLKQIDVLVWRAPLAEEFESLIAKALGNIEASIADTT